jgi:hypothetical protein
MKPFLSNLIPKLVGDFDILYFVAFETGLHFPAKIKIKKEKGLHHFIELYL